MRRMKYDGTFDLSFLEPGETVRHAGGGSCEIISGRSVRADIGDWIIRSSTGELFVGKLRDEGGE